jgi:hypothetical protein
MRQGQQNRRGRNRSGGGGRKPQSALTRNFESNGPNVKIRGTAAHIAEKYLTLARDALSSGDIIVAEGYFQHAEHYNRIIMAAQTERQNGAEQRAAPNGNGRDHHDDFDPDEAGSSDAEAGSASQGAPQASASEAEQPSQPARRRKPANGSGSSDAKAETNGSEPPQQSRGAQARRRRPKVESTGSAHQKPTPKSAKANGAAANGTDSSSDDGASEGFSA